MNHRNFIRLCQFVSGLIFLLKASFVSAADLVPNFKLESTLGVQAEWLYALAPTINLKGTYYFDPVEQKRGPYREYDFLNPTRTIGFRSQLQETTRGLGEYSGFHLGVDTVVPKGKHIFQPRAHYTDYAGLETFGAGLNYAYRLTDTSRVFGGINLNNEELRTGDVQTAKVYLGYRKLWLYDSGRAFAYEFELELTDAENESRSFSTAKFDIDLDYYINQRWSVGLNMSQSGSEIERHESHAFGISTDYFFTKNIGFNFGLSALWRAERSLDVGLGLYFVIRF